MIIGAPVELKKFEKKVLLTPALTQTLTSEGHKVIIEKGLGIHSGFSDEQYTSSGAEIVGSNKDVYSKSDIIIKCNQPQPEEYDLLKNNQIIIAFFNFSKKDNLMNTILAKKITTVNLSKIRNSKGTYPIQEVKSEIVGKTLMRVASNIADKHNGSALIGGVTGVAPAKVTILGAGTVGYNAAKCAAAIGADVSVVDKNPEQLRIFENLPYLKIKTFFSNHENIEKLLPDTDILICAVKRQHKNLPPLVSAKDVSLMKKGTLIIDTGLATGNISVETLDKVMTMDSPTVEKDGIVYFCIADIPSMAAKTSSMAISGAISNYVMTIVRHKNIIDALRDCREIVSGVSTHDGEITDEETAEIFDVRPYELSMRTGF